MIHCDHLPRSGRLAAAGLHPVDIEPPFHGQLSISLGFPDGLLLHRRRKRVWWVA